MQSSNIAAFATTNIGSQLGNSDSDFQTLAVLSSEAEKCLQHIHNLRQNVIRSHEYISLGFSEISAESLKIPITEFKANLERFAKEITDEYE